jgi:hypothetical protein
MEAAHFYVFERYLFLCMKYKGMVIIIGDNNHFVVFTIINVNNEKFVTNVTMSISCQSYFVISSSIINK